MPTESGIVLVGHGSRNRLGNDQFLALARAVAVRCPDLVVEPCFFDHAEPDVPTGIDRVAARGVGRVAVLPLLLFAAGHAKHDIPALMTAAQGRHPGITFHYGRVLGVEQSLVQICADHLLNAESEAVARDRAETAVLLIGRGASDPDANANLCKVARLLWEETQYGMVECAYSDVTWPSVPEGLTHCLQVGARRVIMLPYFLFRGVLMDRLKALRSTWHLQHSEVEFLLAGADGLGIGPVMPNLIAARAAEAFSLPTGSSTLK